MKTRRFISLIVVIIMSFALMAFAPVAQEPPADSTMLDAILTIVVSFATLAGVAALVTALVSILRAAGVIKTDESASQFTAGLNLAAFIVLVLLGVFRPDLSLSFLDGLAAKAATIALFVLGFLTQMTVPAPVNRAFFKARVPVLGVRSE